MKHRVLTPELMDDPAIDVSEHRRALRGLARLNRLGSAAAVDRILRDMLNPDRPLRVLDLATGGGDIPIALSRRCRAHGTAIEFAACDVSPTAIAHAVESAGDSDVRFFVLDALQDPLPEGYDVIVCSLFLHHLTEDDAVRLLRRMAAAAQRGIIVNDLVRSRLNRMLVTIGAHMLSRSPIVHTDARKSAAAAFTVDEVCSLAERTGLNGARFAARFPARFVLRWDKQ